MNWYQFIAVIALAYGLGILAIHLSLTLGRDKVPDDKVYYCNTCKNVLRDRFARCLKCKA